MKENKQAFTPGPWVVKHDKQGLPFIGVASDPWTYQGTVATVDTGDANARLIAAAPDMYKLLQQLSEGNAYDVTSLAIEAGDVLAKIKKG